MSELLVFLCHNFYSQYIYTEGNLEKYQDAVPDNGLVFMSYVTKMYKLLFLFVIAGFLAL
jgi:hypothetical protein